MNKDWSTFRITILLYAVIALLPLNYYFAMHSFDSMKSDGKTMNHLVYINGAIQRLAFVQDAVEKVALISKVSVAFEVIENEFLNDQNNEVFVKLFRADESYKNLKGTWLEFKESVEGNHDIRVSSKKCWTKLNAFSKVTEEMLIYKSENMLDRLYLSLIFTMFVVLAMIFSVRLYMRIQLEKHAIRDLVTDLYNKKYYDEALQTAKLLSTRRNSPLSLITFSLVQYHENKKSMGTKKFNHFLHKFAAVINGLFRQSDVVCRVEENSFVVITPDADLESTRKLASRLIDTLTQHSFDDQSFELQIGFASYEKEDTQDILDVAKKIMKENTIVKVGAKS